MQVAVLSNIEFHIPTEEKYVSLVRKGIRSLLTGLEFNDSITHDVEVAVGEAVTNAICHSRPINGPGRVEIHCSVTSDCVTVEVQDNGSLQCPPSPKTTPSERDEHGRGLHLMHNLMDQVSMRCTEKGMLVRMVKHKKTKNKLSRKNKNALSLTGYC